MKNSDGALIALGRYEVFLVWSFNFFIKDRPECDFKKWVIGPLVVVKNPLWFYGKKQVKP